MIILLSVVWKWGVTPLAGCRRCGWSIVCLARVGVTTTPTIVVVWQAQGRGVVPQHTGVTTVVASLLTRLEIEGLAVRANVLHLSYSLGCGRYILGDMLLLSPRDEGVLPAAPLHGQLAGVGRDSIAVPVGVTCVATPGTRAVRLLTGIVTHHVLWHLSVTSQRMELLRVPGQRRGLGVTKSRVFPLVGALRDIHFRQLLMCGILEFLHLCRP